MPRNDLNAYGSVIARIPQDLLDQVKQYATQHRCTVSELIRDGLEMRLEAGEVPGRPPSGHGRDEGGEVIHEVLHTLKALSPMPHTATLRQTLSEVLHEVLPLYLRKQQESQEGHTEVLQGMTTVLPPHAPAQGGARNGMTEVLPHGVDFDATKFYLADLCKRGHDYQRTGKSLLRKGNSNCVQCQRELRQARDARRSAAQAQEG